MVLGIFGIVQKMFFYGIYAVILSLAYIVSYILLKKRIEFGKYFLISVLVIEIVITAVFIINGMSKAIVHDIFFICLNMIYCLYLGFSKEVKKYFGKNSS